MGCRFFVLAFCFYAKVRKAAYERVQSRVLSHTDHLQKMIILPKPRDYHAQMVYILAKIPGFSILPLSYGEKYAIIS